LTGSADGLPSSGLRADAERNRQRIIDAAEELFARSGLEVPLEDIAQHAGVGIATLYRRFPTRADLVAATFERTISTYAKIVSAALGDPDPWRGFSAMITELCDLQAADAALKDLMTLSVPNSTVVENFRAQVRDDLLTLITRAQATGRLRADFDITDIPMLLLANAGLVTATRGGAPGAGRRFAAYMIQSFRSEATQPLPAPPTQEQITRSLSTSSDRSWA